MVFWSLKISTFKFLETSKKISGRGNFYRLQFSTYVWCNTVSWSFYTVLVGLSNRFLLLFSYYANRVHVPDLKTQPSNIFLIRYMYSICVITKQKVRKSVQQSHEDHVEDSWNDITVHFTYILYYCRLNWSL